MIATALAVLALAGTTAADHVPGCNTYRCDHRIAVKAEKRKIRHWQRMVKPVSAYLDSIAWCESRGRWNLNTGNGFYGGLQFTRTSWLAVGGKGYPHWATKLEQKYRAVLLSRIQGWGAWPVCH